MEIILIASCYGNRDKLRPDGPFGSYADLPYLTSTSGAIHRSKPQKGWHPEMTYNEARCFKAYLDLNLLLSILTRPTLGFLQ